MKHHFSELFFKLYLWSCNMTRDEYWEWIEESIKSTKRMNNWLKKQK